MARGAEDATVAVPTPVPSGGILAVRAAMCLHCLYTLAALLLKRGTNTWLMNVSIVVGVVFLAERASSGTMYREFKASDISSRRSAILDDIPIWINAGLSCAASSCIYPRPVRPMALPIIGASS